MIKQCSMEKQSMVQSVVVLGMQANATSIEHDDDYDVIDAIAYEQVGLGDYWGTEDAPLQPVVFVGFPQNFKSRVDHAGNTGAHSDVTVFVRYEQPLGESVPYEEMGLSRFL